MKYNAINRDQLEKDYKIEHELAQRLQCSPSSERRFLYSDIYEEFHRRIPHDSQLMNKTCPELRARAVKDQLVFLDRFLNRKVTFLEIGCGDCALSYAAAKRVKNVIGFEISKDIPEISNAPENFKLALSRDGCAVPLAPGSIDLAYSNHVVEHLHPDDLLEQTRNIFYCLKKGGIYVCVTPHRFSGPHDISKHFKALEASGLHLKEWTATELANLFRRAGFPQVQIWCGTRGFFFRPPEWIVAKVEDSLSLLNPRFRRRLVLGLPFRPFMNFRLVARKMG